MSFTQELKRQLPEPWRTGVHVFESIDSTNLEAERRLQAAPPLPLLLLAKAQTAGIGRHGRQFASPPATGLYWTAVFNQPAAVPLSLITPAAGVALQAAVSQALGVSTQLKWINDLLKADRKVAGILAEMVPAAVPQLIVGVGLNLAPDPQRDAAVPGQPIGSVLPAAPDEASQAALVARWLTCLDALLTNPLHIMPKFRAHAAWLGQSVTVSEPGHTTTGRLTGFADDGAAILTTNRGPSQFHDGTLRRH